MASARNAAQRFKATLSRQNVIFNLSLAVCFLVGVFSILWAINLKSANEEQRQQLLMFAIGHKIAEAVSGGGARPDTPGSSRAKPLAEEIADLLAGRGSSHGIGAELVRDLGIALLIAVFVTLVIERYASNRLREHIAYDVLSAAYAKIVPPKIYTQVADTIFRSDFYRFNWDVHVRTDDATKPDAPVVIVQTTISYDVENLNEHTVPFLVTAGIDLDNVLLERGIPRFKFIEVTDPRQQRLVNATITAAEAQAVLGSQDSPPAAAPVERGGVTLRRREQQIVLSTPVRIDGRGSIKVTFEVERAIRVPGEFALYAPIPADGIRVTFTGRQGHILDVVAVHPNREAMLRPASNTWQFNYGILPWQGFQLKSRWAEHSQRPKDT